jgi:hypothetical protein
MNMFKKYMSMIFMGSCVGCATVSGPPFVNIESGQPYASLKSNSGLDKEYQVWIGPVDGRFAKKSIFGEAMYGGDTVYISSGLHTVGLRCHNTWVNRYVAIDVEFVVLEKEVYQLTCGPDGSNTKAIFYIHDSKNNIVPYKAKEQNWNKSSDKKST